MPSPRGNLTALCSGSKNPGPGITAEPSSVRNARKNVNDKEFVPLTGAYAEFTGSAGTAVITMEKAALWTDGRYYLQAENQLGLEWTLMRGGSVGVPSYSEWLRDNLSDPSPLRVHDLIYAGVDVAMKLSDARKKLSAAGATGVVITMLEEVAWLFNLCGGNVPHSPVAYAYALVQMDKATLFTDVSKVTPDVEMHLENSSVTVKEYSALLSTIQRSNQNQHGHCECIFGRMYELLCQSGCRWEKWNIRWTGCITQTIAAICAEGHKKCC
ncbi:hypothetical protein SELMODRAFT_403651 [Selaginella moellendorffii]|uniref:Uncharacterized protein n=1 Tax=Selaginella moellendorffii TaxID=88036 RepID=D8QS38_SELML|nr:hypothetical protein SELMODRAFT_403651 [Selaginella moellendorffii]